MGWTQALRGAIQAGWTKFRHSLRELITSERENRALRLCTPQRTGIYLRGHQEALLKVPIEGLAQARTDLERIAEFREQIVHCMSRFLVNRSNLDTNP